MTFEIHFSEFADFVYFLWVFYLFGYKKKQKKLRAFTIYESFCKWRFFIGKMLYCCCKLRKFGFLVLGFVPQCDWSCGLILIHLINHVITCFKKNLVNVLYDLLVCNQAENSLLTFVIFSSLLINSFFFLGFNCRCVLILWCLSLEMLNYYYFLLLMLKNFIFFIFHFTRFFSWFWLPVYFFIGILSWVVFVIDDAWSFWSKILSWKVENNSWLLQFALLVVSTLISLTNDLVVNCKQLFFYF